YNILIGERTAEQAKLAIGGGGFKNYNDADEPRSFDVKGRNLMTGLPAKAAVTSAELQPELNPIALEIIQGIGTTLERTPPELAGDIKHSGLVLTGGGALLTGLDRLIEKRIGVNVKIADNPVDCAALGTMKGFKYLGSHFDGFVRMSSRAH
ncbi:MAG: rod shape-determining protein, partial [Oscillospiraceae bacterium]|nr:rod shape-determining protein [Oscillospiraceae bacterium]